jgi:hypothetical protein
MSDDLRKNMRARVDQCRRLANHINDPRTTEALLKMAQEGEADLAKLEAAEATHIRASVPAPSVLPSVMSEMGRKQTLR